MQRLCCAGRRAHTPLADVAAQTRPPLLDRCENVHRAIGMMQQLCCVGCQTQMFSATAAANSNVGNLGSFSFSGWNYDVQVTGGSRAIYRINDQATFKVRLLWTFNCQVVQLSRIMKMQQGGRVLPCSLHLASRPLQPPFAASLFSMLSA